MGCFGMIMKVKNTNRVVRGGEEYTYDSCPWHIHRKWPSVYTILGALNIMIGKKELSCVNNMRSRRKVFHSSKMKHGWAFSSEFNLLSLHWSKILLGISHLYHAWPVPTTCSLGELQFDVSHRIAHLYLGIPGALGRGAWGVVVTCDDMELSLLSEDPEVSLPCWAMF